MSLALSLEILVKKSVTLLLAHPKHSRNISSGGLLLCCSLANKVFLGLAQTQHLLVFLDPERVAALLTVVEPLQVGKANDQAWVAHALLEDFAEILTEGQDSEGFIAIAIEGPFNLLCLDRSVRERQELFDVVQVVLRQGCQLEGGVYLPCFGFLWCLTFNNNTYCEEVLRGLCREVQRFQWEKSIS